MVWATAPTDINFVTIQKVRAAALKAASGVEDSSPRLTYEKVCSAAGFIFSLLSAFLLAAVYLKCHHLNSYLISILLGV